MIRTYLALGLALSLLAGCSKAPPSVAGKVTLDGQPLATGTIRFVPKDGQTASAATAIKDGAYLAEVPPGDKRVQISASKVVGRRKAYDSPDSPMMDEVRELIPARYNASSELNVTVNSGKNEHDFALKSK